METKPLALSVHETFEFSVPSIHETFAHFFINTSIIGSTLYALKKRKHSSEIKKYI